MKALLLLAFPLALAGCATLTPTEISADIQTVAADVQVATQAACEVVPTVSSVADLIAAGSPLLSTVTAIAQTICSAVASEPVASKRFGARLGGMIKPAPVVIDGVTVTFE